MLLLLCQSVPELQSFNQQSFTQQGVIVAQQTTSNSHGLVLKVELARGQGHELQHDTYAHARFVDQQCRLATTRQPNSIASDGSCLIWTFTGTWEDLEHLQQEYQLLAEMMVNHISPESEQFKDYLAKGDESEYAEMFIRWDRLWGEGKHMNIFCPVKLQLAPAS